MRYFDDFINQFGFLREDLGFELISYGEKPQAFNNFGALLQKDDFHIQITRDRGQVFVEFSIDNSHWHNKDVILNELGILWNRHPTSASGLWKGYAMNIQATELQKYIQDIENYLRDVKH